jgi:hypothetical protein
MKAEPDRRYHPGPITCQVHDSDARLKMMWGPLGTAKTTWLCWRVYYLAKEAAEQGKSLRAIIIRDTYRNLEDSTLKTSAVDLATWTRGLAAIGDSHDLESTARSLLSQQVWKAESFPIHLLLSSCR